MASTIDVLAALLVGGMLGTIGQATRSIAGLKKMFDQAQQNDVSPNEAFSALRFFMSLLIGFIAGMIAVLSLGLEKFSQIGSGDTALLMGIAAAGYAGTDFIEAFASRFQGTASKTDQSVQSKVEGAFQKSSYLNVPSPTLASVAAYVSSDGLLHSTSVSLIKDMMEAKKYLVEIQTSVTKYGLSPSLICAIGSRESHWGIILKPNNPIGTGDFAKRKGKLPPDGLGWGRGLLQIDYAAHEFARSGNWKDAGANIDYGCSVLMGMQKYLIAKLPNLYGDRLMAASLAAYNTGGGNVVKSIKAGMDADSTTAGGDYSRDVLGRASFFKEHGFDDAILTA